MKNKGLHFCCFVEESHIIPCAPNIKREKKEEKNNLIQKRESFGSTADLKSNRWPEANSPGSEHLDFS